MRLAPWGWAALALTSTPALAGAPPPPPVTLTANDPCDVKAASAADWTPAPAGTEIAVGGSVRPRGGGELTLSFSDGIEVHLGTGANATFAPRAWVPGEAGVHGAKPVRASQLLLRSGELTARVPVPEGEAEHQALLVSAPGGTQIGDWRGTVRVLPGDDGVLVTALDGAAMVGSSGKWLTIMGGSGAVLRPRTGPEVHHNVVAAPAWAKVDSSPAFSLVQTGAQASFTLAWSPVDRATKYRIRLATDQAMTHILSTTDAGAATRTTTPQVPPGRYYATVEAAGVEGFVGPPSDARSMRVASMSLPPGASVARDGAILMPANAAITFDDPAGLELALRPVGDGRTASAAIVSSSPTSALTFTPAPPRLKLGTDHLLVAFLKDTASGSVSNLTLAERQLRARVEIGPKFARWPDNQVIARVTLEDPSGRVDISQEEPTMRVKINVDDVAVPWTKSQGFWFAHIPPAIPPGPWLVGVIATDRAGNPIGEGYLEVAGPPRPAGSDHIATDKTEVKITH
jgi:hypothetical protein